MKFPAAALPFLAAGVGAQFVVELRPFQPAPPSAGRLAVHRAVDDAHRACLDDANGSCRPRDPFEEFFRASSSPMRSVFESDPFFRTDPFFRLAATPPSMAESPRLLDQVFGDQMPPPPQMRTAPEAEAEEEFGCLFRALDGMMDSAIRMALAPPQTQRVTIVFGPDGGDDRADVAVSLLDSMVDGLFDHAASASASASNDVKEEAAEEERGADDDGAHAEAAREDDLSPRAAKSRRSNDGEEAMHFVPEPEEEAPVDVAEAEVRGPSSKDPLHPTWDPVVLAHKIAQHGRDVLAEEESRETGPGADGDLRRRRLTEEGEAESQLRRRMARRLTEVVPFGHLAVVAQPIARMVSERPEQDLSPRLGFGYQVDMCLWSLHREEEGAGLSNGCSDALEEVEHSLQQARVEQRGIAQPALVAAAEEPCFWRRYAEFLRLHSSTFFAFWGAVAAFLLVFICLFDEDDEEEYEEEEEYGEASDYVLVQDVIAEEDVDGEHVPAGAVAFVGVPLPVV